MPLIDLTPDELVDQERYPITRLDSLLGARLIAQIHADLERSGACCLQGFLKPEALETMAREAEALVPLAYRGPHEASPYFFNYRTEELDSYPSTHPLRRKTPRILSQIAGDLIPADTSVRRLYHSAPLAEFVARAIGVETLYRSADPYQALNISVMEQGGCQQWHFDTNECVVTLMLQPPEGGGEFQYVPHVRSAEDENYSAVERILDGDHEDVITIPLEAGTLMLFRGRYSLHRVAPVRGQRRRLLTILGFNTSPGMVGSYESSRLHYGPRVQPYVHAMSAGK